MPSRTQLASATAAVLIAACHLAPAATDTPSHTAERTVFTDSVLHTEKCLPTKPGEDWRHVCAPIDQSVRPERKPPE
jgi:hypothetical protein